MTAARGIVIGAATALAGTIASGPLAIGLVAATHPQPPWQDAATFVRFYSPVQAAPYVAGLFLIGGFILLIASLHVLATGHRRVRTTCALICGSAFAAMIFTNYAIQTTVVPVLVSDWSSGNAPLLAALTMANPKSVGWALEMWGYSLLGVATWLCAPVFEGDGIRRFTSIMFAVNGPISLAGGAATTFWPGWVTTSIGYIAFAAWNLLVVAMTALAIVSMRNAECRA